MRQSKNRTAGCFIPEETWWGELMAMEPPGGDGVIGGSTIRFGDEYP
jgi:hypothetical protein